MRSDLRENWKIDGRARRRPRMRYAIVYQRQAQELAKEKNFTAIRSVYHRAFRRTRRRSRSIQTNGPDFFGFVRGNSDAMVDAAREIESAFERHIESRDLNWFVTGSQNSALQVVAECWKEAGQPETR
jgi:hypothetical protein